ncbi:ABC transporter permease [Uliginosibacterium sp. H3]|uniref:ABC transporter permease n=1 Tax=Uliginosibacterium silvisoli TaxID=3114758 RepID=A0ABU6K931_9RHOO|nr:ABC transporter permease [Uliginosibacterium sp. H3]
MSQAELSRGLNAGLNRRGRAVLELTTEPATAMLANEVEHVSKSRRRNDLLRWQAAGLLLPLGVFGILEVVVQNGWIARNLLPAPSDVFESLWQLAGGDLWKHIGASGLRVLAGFVLGAVLAIVLGAAVGFSRRLEALLEPSFQGLRAIPSLAWVPLLLLWLGIDESPKIALIAIGAFFPVYVNVVSGVHNVDRRWVELGKVYGFSRIGLVRRVILPASLPQLFTGLRSGLSLAWMFMVAAELIAASKGLGYLLTDGRETSRPDLVLVAILVLAILGKLTDEALRYLEIACVGTRDTLGNTR